MNDILKSMPKWFLIIIGLYVAAHMSYGFWDGRQVSFWPPSVGPKALDPEPKQISEKAQGKVGREEALYRVGAGIYVAYFWVGRGHRAAAGFRDGFDRARDVIEKQVVPNAVAAGIPNADSKAGKALAMIRAGDADEAFKALNRLYAEYLATVEQY